MTKKMKINRPLKSARKKKIQWLVEKKFLTANIFIKRWL